MNGGKKYSDEEIIDGISRNDSAVLEHFYYENFRKVRYHVISNSGNEEDARDIFQESMVVLYRKLKNPEFILTSTLATLVFGIARILWLKELTARSKDNVELKVSLDEYLITEKDTSDLIEKNERLKLYREKFEELSDDCKRVLHMFLNNISITEITRIMGYSSDQHTKNRRFRCKKSLIQKIRNSLNYKELGNETDIDN